jgi:flagellin-like protein
MLKLLLIAMRFERQTTDSGVSPVVGVILMVAITVILSAIIATFVLDLGGSVSQNPAAGVTFDKTASDTVQIQIVSMENADSLDYKATGGSWTDLGNSVGASASVSGLSDGDTVTVRATLDGKQSVTQTYTHDA